MQSVCRRFNRFLVPSIGSGTNRDQHAARRRRRVRLRDRQRPNPDAVRLEDRDTPGGEVLLDRGEIREQQRNLLARTSLRAAAK